MFSPAAALPISPGRDQLRTMRLDNGILVTEQRMLVRLSLQHVTRHGQGCPGIAGKDDADAHQLGRDRAGVLPQRRLQARQSPFIVPPAQ